ncbi:MAG: DUF5050 domain-containing protein [Eubacterium sp.]|nr:DUF5050 domain-containing protein [Eubacterium sp.]
MEKLKNVYGKLLMLALVMMCAGGILASGSNVYGATATDGLKGKYIYTGEGDTMYKVNTQNGKAKKAFKIKKLKDYNGLYGNAYYYKGYLYFVADLYLGTDSANLYICRCKPNGKGFKKLARGYSFRINGKKIYYIKQKDKGEYFVNVGITSMKLNGKGKKVIKSSKSIRGFDFNGNKILYTLNNKIYQMNKNGSSIKSLSLTNNNINTYVDGDYVLYTKFVKTGTSYGSDVGYYEEHVYGLKDGTDVTVCKGTEDESAEIQLFENGVVYYSFYDSGTITLYKYELSTGETSKVKKFKDKSWLTMRYVSDKVIVSEECDAEWTSTYNAGIYSYNLKTGKKRVIKKFVMS